MRASEKKRACKRKVDTNISYNFANACPFLLFTCKCFIPHCLVLSADNLKAAQSKAYSASNAKPISVHTRRTSLRMASKVFIKKQINVARSDLRKTDMKVNPAYRKTLPALKQSVHTSRNSLWKCTKSGKSKNQIIFLHKAKHPSNTRLKWAIRLKWARSCLKVFADSQHNGLAVPAHKMRQLKSKLTRGHLAAR